MIPLVVKEQRSSFLALTFDRLLSGTETGHGVDPPCLTPACLIFNQSIRASPCLLTSLAGLRYLK
jgi:hypothetical protein